MDKLMAKIKVSDVSSEEKITKFRQSKAEFVYAENPSRIVNPWNVKPTNVPIVDQTKYVDLVNQCRFYYKKDALTSTTINKLVEIGINDLEFSKNGLSDNEFRVFTGLKQQLLDFSEDMALEFLLSGLVVPEFKYVVKGKDDIKRLGVKKYDSLTLPDSLWLRDPTTIEIKKTILSNKPSYYVIIPDDLSYFIKTKGKYPDGTEDLKLYAWLVATYPRFVADVEAGKGKVLLENPYVVRRRAMQGSPYPIPYLSAALDILEHKRNLRKADYSVATRVISSILHVKVGSDEFPMTEAEEDLLRLSDVKEQLRWRNTNYSTVENIFQFFSDHTVSLQWVFPDTKMLLDSAKYQEVNQELIFALGFPRTLIAGESERSNASDPQYAAIAPVKTMENFRNKILNILQQVIYDVATKNNFSSVPDVSFKPINLYDFRIYLDAMKMLLDTGSLSRTTLAKIFGYSFNDELELRTEEQTALEDSGVPEFQPTPNSRAPQIPAKPAPATPKKPAQTPVKKPTTPKK
jgi:hypothetical protein